MKITQSKWSTAKGWQEIRHENFDNAQCSLVIAFGNRILLTNPEYFNTIRLKFPNANILMNSTSGEIIDTQVNDDTITLTAIQFDSTVVLPAVVDFNDCENSYDAGRKIANQFDKKNLINILVIADGQKVNGSELVQGLQQHLPSNIIITGGLAGDGSRFEKTLVGLNNAPTEGQVVAVGFYGNNIRVTHGSMGGWDPFGPERLVTKSNGNILFELDGQPALDIYKNYLGEFSKDLPGSGLLFPLNVRLNGDAQPVVRTILNINENDRSLTFAGNIPEGSYAQLMKANFDRLIEGASTAAQNCTGTDTNPDLAILISCVGRKLVLNQRIEEEVEVIRETFGNHTALTGFYSYGEISPITGFSRCELHNQTMTITTISERSDVE